MRGILGAAGLGQGRSRRHPHQRAAGEAPGVGLGAGWGRRPQINAISGRQGGLRRRRGRGADAAGRSGLRGGWQGPREGWGDDRRRVARARGAGRRRAGGRGRQLHARRATALKNGLQCLWAVAGQVGGAKWPAAGAQPPACERQSSTRQGAPSGRPREACSGDGRGPCKPPRGPNCPAAGRATCWFPGTISIIATLLNAPLPSTSSMANGISTSQAGGLFRLATIVTAHSRQSYQLLRDPRSPAACPRMSPAAPPPP